MPTDRLFLLLATVAFLVAMVRAIVGIRRGTWKTGGTGQLLTMALGFGLQTGAVFLRGEEVGQCPMRSVSDIQVFIAWSVVLLYFLVGSAYRVSLLGVFTAPLVAGMHILAFSHPDAFPAYPPKFKIDPYVELHAALALVSYAAFALACITGVMYLLQERFLKRHHISGLFYRLPPIQGLAKAIQRLVWLGVILLTISLAISLTLQTSIPQSKLILAWIVWGLYSVIGVIIWRHALSPRHTAWLAAVGFVIPFLSLWLVTSHA